MGKQIVNPRSKSFANLRVFPKCPGNAQKLIVSILSKVGRRVDLSLSFKIPKPKWIKNQGKHAYFKGGRAPWMRITADEMNTMKCVEGLGSK